MKFPIWLFFIILSCTLHAQDNIYYINMPSTLKVGTITYDLHKDANDSTFTIILSNLPNKVQDAGYFLTCEKKFKKIDKGFLANKKIVTPEVVMDSLTQAGRSFFRKNTFYIFFIRGENYYIHKATGEYIFMDYRKE